MTQQQIKRRRIAIVNGNDERPKTILETLKMIIATQRKTNETLQSNINLIQQFSNK